MTRQTALEILADAYPEALVTEIAGNPNIIGAYLFTVDGNHVQVLHDGTIFEEIVGMEEQF